MLSLLELREREHEIKSHLKHLQHRLTEVPENREEDIHNILTTHEMQTKPIVRDLITESIEDLIDIRSAILDVS